MAKVDLGSHEELQFVISIIYKKALDEGHYCETYADMVYALKNRYPEFSDGDKKNSFTRDLLNICQKEYEDLSESIRELTAEEKAVFKKEDDLRVHQFARRKRPLNNMKFIGLLFLRQLLSVKVITTVIEDLLQLEAPNDKPDAAPPEEFRIECVIELIQNIGYTLEMLSGNQSNLAPGGGLQGQGGASSSANAGN